MTVTAASDVPDDFRRTLIALYPSLIRFARRLGEKPADAQDLVHAAIERALAKRRYFRGGVLESWIRAIIRNLLVDRRRHFQILREIPWNCDHLAYEPALPLGSEEPAYRQSEAYNMEDLRRAVRRLSPALRVIYEMASFERASYREIGLRLSLKLDTVGTRLYRARQALRVILESESPASRAQDGRTRICVPSSWDDPSQIGSSEPHSEAGLPKRYGRSARAPAAGFAAGRAPLDTAPRSGVSQPSLERVPSEPRAAHVTY